MAASFVLRHVKSWTFFLIVSVFPLNPGRAHSLSPNF
jgi:hypothetical protein